MFRSHPSHQDKINHIFCQLQARRMILYERLQLKKVARNKVIDLFIDSGAWHKFGEKK